MSDIKGESAKSKSNNQGRAYEYAWINALNNKISETRKTEIDHNSSWYANLRAWNSLSKEEKDMYNVSARSAVDSLIDLEPIMIEDDADTLSLKFQTDNEGKRGDVRDILIIRGFINWEIGLSVKHNSDAVKHSRISQKLDFGKEWYGIPCSKNYWDEVNPVFDSLEQAQNQLPKGLTWKEFDEKYDKEKSCYIPLLEAFMTEIKKAYEQDPKMVKRLAEYLIGKFDYYKVIGWDKTRTTWIRTFNFNGKLNQPAKKRKSEIFVPRPILPTELIDIKLHKPKPGRKTTTVDMYLDNGWSLSFRIHNGEGSVVPSLKFDVEFLGTPVSVLSIECKWTSN